MPSEIVSHKLLVKPTVGCFLTQAFYHGWKGNDERVNILWPAEQQHCDPTPLDNSCLVAVFHIIKIKNHA